MYDISTCVSSAEENILFGIILAQIHIIICLLGIVPESSFPCASNGLETCANLIKSESGCKEQKLHYDFDRNLYDPLLNKDYDRFHGASVIINHSFHIQYVRTIRGLECLSPCSLIVMRGDFLHAGDANCYDYPLYRYFFYIDPKEGYRTKSIQDKIYINQSNNNSR